MKIYTRTGDGGETGLFGGGRVPKSHPRVSAYGSVDELNSFLGAALVSMEDSASRERLAVVQHDLFVVGALLAAPDTGSDDPSVPALPVGRIEEMERWMDEASGSLAALRSFIIPGGSPGAVALHVARTVCRRAERALVALGEHEPLDEAILRYLNRLSDLLFVLARLENHRAGTPDVLWNAE